MGKALGNGTKRGCLGNGQIRDNVACNCIMDRTRGSEGTLSRFLDCNGDSKRILLSDLRECVNIALQCIRISLSIHVSCSGPPRKIDSRPNKSRI